MGTKKSMSKKEHQKKSMNARWLSSLKETSLVKLFAGSMGLVLAVSLVWGVAVYANTAISQSYIADEPLPIGSIVSLKEDSSDRVEAANIDNVDNILGVVINENNSMIKLSGDQENQVPVANSGTFSVLVSDINGDINRGDHITASPINAVGMKATSNIKVVGIAQSALTQEQGHEDTYTDENGEEHPVLLGEVPVQVDIAYYFKEPDKTIIPSAVQNVTDAIAGKPTKPLPIIISGIIFIITLIAVASIIFSMIRGSIISVGRNPMSQSAVYRNVMQLTALVIGILSVAIASIYLLLTRF